MHWHRRPFARTRAHRWQVLNPFISDETPSDFVLHGVELWSCRSQQLIAGELGYTIGRTYTSLSGFHTPDRPGQRRWRNFGTLQSWLLAKRLEDRAYAFWNLGHPYMEYKLELGARVLERADFLQRWIAHRDEPLARSIASG